MQHVLTEEILRLGAHSIFIYENTMTLLAQAHLKALKFEQLSSLLAYTGCHLKICAHRNYNRKPIFHRQ